MAQKIPLNLESSKSREAYKLTSGGFILPGSVQAYIMRRWRVSSLVRRNGETRVWLPENQRGYLFHYGTSIQDDIGLNFGPALRRGETI